MAVFIVGAGGVGRDTLEVADAACVPIDAFLDDAVDGTVQGLPVLRPEMAAAGSSFVVAIADPYARVRLAALLVERGLQPITLVHPQAVLARDVALGGGSIVMSGAHVSTSAVLDDHAQVHHNSTVGHDTIVGAHSSVFPGAHIGGAVDIGRRATIGSGAIVLQQLAIGEDALVGAGAVVTADVAAHTVVAGVPARPVRSKRRGRHLAETRRTS